MNTVQTIKKKFFLTIKFDAVKFNSWGYDAFVSELPTSIQDLYV